ncbi:MAG: DUF445 family protein, partial [Bacteroidetes bacterium]|nr:DUF445 family protein [Bacteroidota bacterium]
MIDTIKTFLQKHYAFDSLFQKGEKTNQDISFNQFKLSTSKKLVMYALKVSPIFCSVGFIGLFLMQLAGQISDTALIQSLGLETSFANLGNMFTSHQILNALYIISVSGLIGYGTNYIAIRMLFRPVNKRPVWGQGLIPAQRDRIIVTLAQGMHKHVLNEDLIRMRVEETGLVSKVNNLVMDGTSNLVLDEELRKILKKMIFDSINDYAQRQDIRVEIRNLIDQRLENNLDGGLKKFLLQTYKKYNEKDYHEVIDKVVNDIPKVAIEVIEKMEAQLDRVAAYIRLQKGYTEKQIMNIFVDLLNRIDITGLLAKQMEHFDEAKLEKMVWEATNEQLLYIQYLGTVLGILGGMLIWQPQIMGGIYILLFSFLWVLDNVIFKMKTKALKA